MEPAKLDDRELGCIDFFLFCCLLSSGFVWPTSWAILAPSWAILASSWTILAPSGAIRAPSWLPKASRSLPRLNQGFPRCSPRPPEQKIIKAQKIIEKGSISGQISEEIWRADFFEEFAKTMPSRGFCTKCSKNHRKSIPSRDFFYYFFAKDFFNNLLKGGLSDTNLRKGKRFWHSVSWHERACPSVSERERNDPPPISKTLVMVQSDPTRTPTQLIRIDFR